MSKTYKDRKSRQDFKKIKNNKKPSKLKDSKKEKYKNWDSFGV